MLVFAGLDPSNGAGLGADLEAIRAGGGWALSVPTALTVQDTHDVARVVPVDPGYLLEAALRISADVPVAAVKVGLLSSLGTLEALLSFLDLHPGLPLVVDPVFKAGGGSELSGQALIAACRRRLLPRATITTPNRCELARLAGEYDDDVSRAMALCAEGPAVLVTGTDPLPGETAGETIEHVLHRAGSFPLRWQWPRLPGRYHGSGCTLASRLAVALATGESLERACEIAQRFTWDALAASHALGGGQRLPERWPARRAP